jgi:hypothetical protein
MLSAKPRVTCQQLRKLVERRRSVTMTWNPYDVVVGAPHLCGGRSALALRERVSTLITRFSAGKAKA